jgi:soluble lytic murein transglycosylase-like protein
MGRRRLMPGTVARLGVSDAFNVERNLAGGVNYLEHVFSQFNQKVPLPWPLAPLKGWAAAEPDRLSREFWPGSQ